MKLIARYLADYNGLTRKDKARYWRQAVLILTPLAALILAHHHHGPSLGRIMGWAKP